VKPAQQGPGRVSTRKASAVAMRSATSLALIGTRRVTLRSWRVAEVGHHVRDALGRGAPERVHQQKCAVYLHVLARCRGFRLLITSRDIYAAIFAYSEARMARAMREVLAGDPSLKSPNSSPAAHPMRSRPHSRKRFFASHPKLKRITESAPAATQLASSARRGHGRKTKRRRTGERPLRSGYGSVGRFF
jgi:hypothetical protein